MPKPQPPKDVFNRTIIYATGVFLEPRHVVEVVDGVLKVDEWRWEATEFEDDSFMDGEYCDPQVSADTEEELLKLDDDDGVEIAE